MLGVGADHSADHTSIGSDDGDRQTAATGMPSPVVADWILAIYASEGDADG
jgi:hypothetical protein